MKKFIALVVAGIASLVASQAQAGILVRQCAAQAFCPQTGRTVACLVYSDPFYGQSCTFEARMGYGVRCTGWDLAGRWVVYQDYCIY